MSDNIINIELKGYQTLAQIIARATELLGDERSIDKEVFLKNRAKCIVISEEPLIRVFHIPYRDKVTPYA